jgi:hypothetical protein
LKLDFAESGSHKDLDVISMARAKKVSKNAELADAIDSWAKTHALSENPYLKGVSTAIRGNKNLAMWASLDPAELLPFINSKSENTLQTLNHLMVLIRNVLVFFPVALTWIAVSKATTAFSIYTVRNAVSVVNFLDFWQNGYGVLAKEWTIGRVAFIDFLLILFVIILTLVTSLLSRRIEHNQMDYEKDVDNSRTKLIIDISEFLFDKQKVTTAIVNQSIGKTVQDLKNASSVLDKSTVKVEKLLKEIVTLEVKRSK